jgi:hypothetical protein
MDFELKFLNLNVSLQIGDILYYVTTQDQSGFTLNESYISQIGPVTNITKDGEVSTIVIQISEIIFELGLYPSEDDYIFFSKDNIVNTSSILGYYGLARFKNESTDKAELYSAACEISTSSK